MPATVTLAGPVARRVYTGRLVSVCTGERESYAVVYSVDGWRVTEVPIPAAAYSIAHAAPGQVLAAAYGVLEDNPHLIDTLRTLQEP